jgi:hypothetical protein
MMSASGGGEEERAEEEEVEVEVEEVEEEGEEGGGAEFVVGEQVRALGSEEIADQALRQAREQSAQMLAQEQSAAEEKRAMEARLARLEAALAEKGKKGSSDLLGRQLPDFAVPTPAGVGRSNDDDSFTMVGLSVQTAHGGPVESQALPDVQDQRQARLESALRRKKEAEEKRVKAQDEDAKQDARRMLRKELLFLDNELDSMTNASTEGPTSHLIASKWLLEFAYSKYPPRSFSAQRAKEELRAVRELRFRDAVLKALKLFQSRYSPEKNSVAQFGAEWAVMAEEFAKHAFALQAGMTRGAKQGAVCGGDVFSHRSTNAHGGDDGFGEVEDAD